MAISIFLHDILLYAIFFVEIFCSKFSYFLLIFYLDHFRVVSPFPTLGVKFYQIRKLFQIRKFLSKLKPCQQGRYLSVCYHMQEITMNNLFQFFDYLYLKAQADIVVNNFFFTSSYGRVSMIQVRHNKRIGTEGLFFYHPNLLCCLDQTLAVMELSQHHVSSSKTVRPIILRGARCMGHVKIIWSAVCSLAPHSHFAEEA